MKPKNSLSILLMTSSLVLLIVLQIFWLRSSYEKAFHDLRNKIDGHFRNAVFTVRDSSFLRRVEYVPNDSIAAGAKNIFFSQHIDSIPVDRIKSVNVDKESSQIQIYISGTGAPDSLKALLQPIASRLGESGFRGGTRFTYRVNADTLNLDSIKSYFKRSLMREDLNLPFEIKKTKFSQSFQPPGSLTPRMNRIVITNDRINPRVVFEERHLSVYGDTIQSQWVRIPPLSRYAVQLNHVRPTLLRVIAPQIFFSGVLTLVTTMAFIFMYRSIRSQQRLMQLKNDFISNVTHELKTPIATVSVALEALKNFKGIDNPKLTDEYLDIAQHELNRLTILADKVLTTSLLDEQGIVMEFEKVNLEKTVSDVLDSLKLIFEKREAKLDFHKTGDDFTLTGSNIHLTNVVHNLVDNALKYSPQQPQISVALTDAGDHIALSVTDQGLGIPSEFHKKVFEKFFRMPTGDVHNIKGYGLGLSYVESVIKSHQGTIHLTSQSGSGSTFTISLKKSRS